MRNSEGDNVTGRRICPVLPELAVETINGDDYTVATVHSQLASSSASNGEAFATPH